jgi:hypothetical protein
MKAKSIPNYILQGYKRIKVPGQRIYMCNKEGVVINAKTGGKIKPFLSRTGYFVVSLNGNTMSIHRIVATLFVEKTNPRFNTVNHKNEIRTDNRAENLEWCSVFYNVNYGNARKKRQMNAKKDLSFHKISVKAVKEGKEIFYDSMAAASKATGVNLNSIFRCVHGVNKTTKSGYSFVMISRSPTACYAQQPISLVAIKDGEKVVFNSINEAAKAIGVHRMSIWRCLKGFQNSCKGWAFSYDV